MSALDPSRIRTSSQNVEWAPSRKARATSAVVEESWVCVHGWPTFRGRPETSPRFDLAVNPNEPNRFGWIVEIDPRDPDSTPLKRTALGRLKHEIACFAEADDGRAVIYTGDDEVFQCLYKFVSSRR